MPVYNILLMIKGEKEKSVCVRAYNKNARVHFIRKLIRLPHEVIISPRISIIACVHYIKAQ